MNRAPPRGGGGLRRLLVLLLLITGVGAVLALTVLAAGLTFYLLT